MLDIIYRDEAIVVCVKPFRVISTDEPVIHLRLSPLPKKDMTGPVVFTLILSDSYSNIPVEPSTVICLLPVISISG